MYIYCDNLSRLAKSASADVNGIFESIPCTMYCHKLQVQNTSNTVAPIFSLFQEVRYSCMFFATEVNMILSATGRGIPLRTGK